MSSAESPFTRIGGATAVAKLVDRFYDNMDTLPEARGIRALHAPDLTPMRDTLKKYFTEWLGGPPLYSSEKGHPRLRARHLPFPIGESERNQWMLCMSKALDEVVADANTRSELADAIYRLADFMRNR